MDTVRVEAMCRFRAEVRNKVMFEVMYRVCNFEVKYRVMIEL